MASSVVFGVSKIPEVVEFNLLFRLNNLLYMVNTRKIIKEDTNEQPVNSTVRKVQKTAS